MSLIGLIAALAISGMTQAPPPSILHGEAAAAYNAFVAGQILADREDYADPCPSARGQWLMRSVEKPANLAPGHREASIDGGGVVERVRVSGCGRTTIHNVLVVKVRGRGWRGFLLPLGESRAGPLLQSDAGLAMARAAMQLTPNAPCPANLPPARRLVFGAVTGIPSPPGGSWSERWPLTYCGIDRTFVVTFRPTADGGADWSLRPVWQGAPEVR